jgi:plasmid maintenance system antidote protein VapI
MSELITLADVAVRCDVTVRTAQRHAAEHAIGSVIGGMRVLTQEEADRLAAVINAARPGRPPCHRGGTE